MCKTFEFYEVIVDGIVATRNKNVVLEHMLTVPHVADKPTAFELDFIKVLY
jgi:hypothetical protein